MRNPGTASVRRLDRVLRLWNDAQMTEVLQRSERSSRLAHEIDIANPQSTASPTKSKYRSNQHERPVVPGHLFHERRELQWGQARSLRMHDSGNAMFRAGDRAIKSALTAALSTARSAEKSRATVAGAATFDRRSTASWISPGVSPIRSTEPR